MTWMCLCDSRMPRSLLMRQVFALTAHWLSVDYRCFGEPPLGDAGPLNRSLESLISFVTCHFFSAKIACMSFSQTFFSSHSTAVSMSVAVSEATNWIGRRH
jgi:hypothetical protein